MLDPKVNSIFTAYKRTSCAFVLVVSFWNEKSCKHRHNSPSAPTVPHACRNPTAQARSRLHLHRRITTTKSHSQKQKSDLQPATTPKSLPYINSDLFQLKLYPPHR